MSTLKTHRFEFHGVVEQIKLNKDDELRLGTQFSSAAGMGSRLAATRLKLHHTAADLGA